MCHLDVKILGLVVGGTAELPLWSSPTCMITGQIWGRDYDSANDPNEG